MNESEKTLLKTVHCVKYSKDQIKRFWNKVVKTETCWIWKGAISGRRYGGLGINGIAYRAHRFSWIIHFGEIPKSLCVCHSCDNPVCVNPSHLWIGSVFDNNRDKMNKGRCPDMKAFWSQNSHRLAKGEKIGMAKLTSESVIKIRKEYASGGTTHRKLASIYGVDHSTISDILNRKLWVHI